MPPQTASGQNAQGATLPPPPPPAPAPEVIAEQLKTSLEGTRLSTEYLLNADFVK